MKAYQNLLVIILASCFFNCKQETANKLETIDTTTTVVKTDSVFDNNTQQEKQEKTPKQNYYVSANSGLNYRDKPEGKVLGKIEINTRVNIVKNTGVFETIKESNKDIKGEWVGFLKESDTVYIFDAFLSENRIEDDSKYNYPILKDSSLVIYSLNGYKRSQGKWSSFISLSDSRYQNYNEEKFINEDDLEENQNYFVLDKAKRVKFFNNIRIKETDTLFVYNYDVIYKYEVSQLGLIITPDAYDSGYMIGFDLHGKIENGEFAYVGKENPFVINQLQPIVWDKINENKTPYKFSTQIIDIRRRWWFNDVEINGTYKYSNKDFDFYLQELKRNYSKDYYLVIVNTKTNEKIFEEVYIDSESTEASPIVTNINREEVYENAQWTGYLFKDKPLVVFGFQYYSFGCPSINFIETPKTYIPIYCDNRH
ncbi:MAG: hypothetical protein WBF67_10295 [Olleya sp.]